MIDTITPLPYRLYRAGTQLTSAVFPDDGQHQMTIAHKLGREHRVQLGDVLVMDLAVKGEVQAHLAFRFERDGTPVPIRMSEELRK